MKTLFVVVLVVVALGFGYWLGRGSFFSGDDENWQTITPPPPVTITPPPPPKKSNLIRVNSPRPDDIVKSPLQISGEARGYWYFEASFPVSLYDANGNLLARGPAQADGEWMTENFVPFALGLKFSTPETDTGVLVFEKDNPSGLPENADEYRMPVRFR